MTHLDVRPAAERATTRNDWLTAAYSFSFDDHYDPANTSFGLLLANNEFRVAAGHGFAPHTHRGLEILTWVLSGALSHHDSQGNAGTIRPGQAQHLSAGSGVTHSELNGGSEPARFVQMWVLADVPGPPGYHQVDVGDALAAGGLVPIASGLSRHRGSGAMEIRQSAAALSVARLDAGGDSIALPPAPYVHIYLTRGAAVVESAAGTVRLAAGDALRVSNAQWQQLSATSTCEVLVWEMHRSV